MPPHNTAATSTRLLRAVASKLCTTSPAQEQLSVADIKRIFSPGQWMRGSDLGMCALAARHLFPKGLLLYQAESRAWYHYWGSIASTCLDESVVVEKMGRALPHTYVVHNSAPGHFRSAMVRCSNIDGVAASLGSECHLPCASARSTFPGSASKSDLVRNHGMAQDALAARNAASLIGGAGSRAC